VPAAAGLIMNPSPDIDHEDIDMPHVNIKHLPTELDERRESALVSEITQAVKSAFGVDEAVISITLESVAPELWHEQVYVPEIINRQELLRKVPQY
jgi:phenylpyruvate tautomerase PptA (4-oxalocrotonate tautomerase family)